MKTIFKKNYSDYFFDIINYLILSIILILVIYPLILIASSSISDPQAILTGKVWLFPVNITFDGFKLILKNNEIWNGYKNSIIYAGLGTSINLFMTISAAYPLSRKDFYARKVIMWIYTFTMFFGGGLIPAYLLVRELKMLDTIWAMIIPNAVAVWNIIIARTYFQSNIPDELREAAFLDGCSNIKFLIKIVLPLSKPIIAVLTLFYCIGHWNSYFNALIYLSTRDKFPLQLVLRDILLLSQVERELTAGVDAKAIAEKIRIGQGIKYGVIIVSSLPPLIFYPFVQKYFVKGIMVGSLKG